jgi:hypothetical protein
VDVDVDVAVSVGVADSSALELAEGDDAVWTPTWYTPGTPSSTRKVAAWVVVPFLVDTVEIVLSCASMRSAVMSKRR